ncbi:MAG: DUF4390 domain-containing protein [Thermodesulfovibrionia bacterium]|nr:DUF4390 domain-containing protein [Thermodesulfovibrionia bacterium]
MKKSLFVFAATILLALAPSFVNAASMKIIGPDAMIKENDIIVTTGVVNVKDLEKSVNSGIEKEVIFTVELFRVWAFWPDEFVSAKKIKMMIRYDNLRDQYWASSSDNKDMETKRFKDFESIQNWLSSISPISLGNVKGFDKGEYYVRVVIESKSREYPLFIGMLMHLIPETEMSLAKESGTFIVGEAK